MPKPQKVLIGKVARQKENGTFPNNAEGGGIQILINTGNTNYKEIFKK